MRDLLTAVDIVVIPIYLKFVNYYIWIKNDKKIYRHHLMYFAPIISNLIIRVLFFMVNPKDGPADLDGSIVFILILSGRFIVITILSLIAIFVNMLINTLRTKNTV